MWYHKTMLWYCCVNLFEDFCSWCPWNRVQWPGSMTWRQLPWCRCPGSQGGHTRGLCWPHRSVQTWAEVIDWSMMRLCVLYSLLLPSVLRKKQGPSRVSLAWVFSDVGSTDVKTKCIRLHYPYPWQLFVLILLFYFAAAIRPFTFLIGHHSYIHLHQCGWRETLLQGGVSPTNNCGHLRNS